MTIKIKSGGKKQDFVNNMPPVQPEPKVPAMQEPQESWYDTITRNISAAGRNTADLAQSALNLPDTIINTLGQGAVKGYEYLTGKQTDIGNMLRQAEHLEPEYASDFAERLGAIGPRTEPRNNYEWLFQRAAPQLALGALSGGALLPTAARTGLGSLAALGAKEVGFGATGENIADFAAQLGTGAFNRNITPNRLRKSAENIKSKAFELRDVAAEKVGNVPSEGLRKKVFSAVSNIEKDLPADIIKSAKDELNLVSKIISGDKTNLRDVVGRVKAINEKIFDPKIDKNLKRLYEGIKKPLREFIVEHGEKNPDLGTLDALATDLNYGLKKTSPIRSAINKYVKSPNINPVAGAALNLLFSGGIGSFLNPKLGAAALIPGTYLYLNKAYDLLSGSKVLRKLAFRGLKEAARESVPGLLSSMKHIDKEVTRLTAKEKPIKKSNIKIKKGGLKS